MHGVPSSSKANLTHLFLQGGPNSKVWLVWDWIAICLPHTHSSAWCMHFFGMSTCVWVWVYVLMCVCMTASFTLILCSPPHRCLWGGAEWAHASHHGCILGLKKDPMTQCMHYTFQPTINSVTTGCNSVLTHCSKKAGCIMWRLNNGTVVWSIAIFRGCLYCFHFAILLYGFMLR